MFVLMCLRVREKAPVCLWGLADVSRKLVSSMLTLPPDEYPPADNFVGIYSISLLNIHNCRATTELKETIMIHVTVWTLNG